MYLDTPKTYINVYNKNYKKENMFILAFIFSIWANDLEFDALIECVCVIRNDGSN